MLGIVCIYVVQYYVFLEKWTFLDPNVEEEKKKGKEISNRHSERKAAEKNEK